MNPNWTDAQDWIDIVDHIIIGLVIVLAAGVPAWISAKTHKSLKTETKVIRDQLVNGHSTALREDVDRAIAAIETLSHDVRGLRADLMTEEERRRRDVADLEQRIGRHRRQEG